MDMYHLSRSCTALQRLVSNAPMDLLRKAAFQTLPASLVKPKTPVHQLWASLRRHQQLVHHLHHITHSPMSYTCSWATPSVAMPEDALGNFSIVSDKRFEDFDPAAVAARNYWEIHPSETMLLWPAQVGHAQERATMLGKLRTSMEERYRLQGPLHEAIPPAVGQQQSVAKWYEWSPNGSMIAILWGPARSTPGSPPGQLTLSVLRVYAAESGAMVSAIQPASSVDDSLELEWLADGSGFCTRCSDGAMTEVSVINTAGQVLSVSSTDWEQLSDHFNHMYLALRPNALWNVTGPVHFVDRMTGKIMSMPADINAELDECCLAMALSWSANSQYATLLSADGSRRWFMCFDKGRLAYSQSQVIPLPLVAPPTSLAEDDPIEVFFSPHGRALAAEVALPLKTPSSPKLLLWDFAGNGPAAFVHVLSLSESVQLENPRYTSLVAWHPSPSIDIVAFSDGAQLGLFSAATKSCLCCWSSRQLLGAEGQPSPALHPWDLRKLFWASHGCQLVLLFCDNKQLTLDFDSR